MQYSLDWLDYRLGMLANMPNEVMDNEYNIRQKKI